MAVLTIEQSNQINDLIRQANCYRGDNVYQDVFYQSDLVDIDATEGCRYGNCNSHLWRQINVG
ncbi:hypothetical protein [Argonema antarcticum]|uniref:hypothetical protein n=1 Tax=Argonema antarcticum TaxID=2942763 RepID=UPI0020111D30|nr:hypothetical protein [Argonema antarcticum]MCL1471780.1 hypothetical protein [Argonema antarcticum A004/B2]